MKNIKQQRKKVQGWKLQVLKMTDKVISGGGNLAILLSSYKGDDQVQSNARGVTFFQKLGVCVPPNPPKVTPMSNAVVL